MCPLRFLLVFFSAVLAGYFAWRTVSSSDESAVDAISGESQVEQKDKRGFNFKRTMENGFWVFVDMASGRYLWRNLKEMRGKSH
ncbi:PREDICTED: uncharacterized protein LOC104820773 [Tarenaya hassleriana]|uniref:uncharacterized protein LOC104820773 n=1 Tax=Tarenaya hassleriana TaxID=28532 RepID=UPI00053CAA03|nr:PREDICTED: uncharacterized protein LOC104820773 [Tarenaya hassleriana]XP_010549673.1 PREDICTED: uncharacterized protein LOC104820773 [Tarenaya hassleriana]